MQTRLHKLLWASLYALVWVVCLVTVAFIVLVVKARIFDVSTRELENAATIEKRLPPGCKIVDLGPYGNIPKVVAIVCDDNKTQTMNWVQPLGDRAGTTVRRVTVVIGKKHG